jgi:tripartite-type tricarboxylate transporter receptor subunit TctC
VSQTIGQQVIVENQGGAGGTVGAANVAKRAPDGYNWFMGAVHHTIAESLYARLQYKLERDFEPITVAAFIPNVVVVHPRYADKIKTLKDLIDYARANPGRLNYGSAGSGTTHHLSVELFKTMTKTFMVHIPYQGAGPLMIGLLSGQVDLAFDGMGTSSTQVRAGKLIPLAVTSVARNPALPNVPTVAEAGVPGYEVRTWYALWALKGTPQAIKDRMYKEVVVAMNPPELKKFWAEQCADPGGMPPAEFDAIKSEIAKSTRWSGRGRESTTRLDRRRRKTLRVAIQRRDKQIRAAASSVCSPAAAAATSARAASPKTHQASHSEPCPRSGATSRAASRARLPAARRTPARVN